MSDDRTDNEDEKTAGGIFDLFEPPPEIDPNRFGPIPVVPDDGSPPVEDPEHAHIDLSAGEGTTEDASATGEATISSISACIDATSASASGSRPVAAPRSSIWR